MLWGRDLFLYFPVTRSHDIKGHVREIVSRNRWVIVLTTHIRREELRLDLESRQEGYWILDEDNGFLEWLCVFKMVYF